MDGIDGRRYAVTACKDVITLVCLPYTAFVDTFDGFYTKENRVVSKFLAFLADKRCAFTVDRPFILLSLNICPFVAASGREKVPFGFRRRANNPSVELVTKRSLVGRVAGRFSRIPLGLNRTFLWPCSRSLPPAKKSDTRRGRRP